MSVACQCFRPILIQHAAGCACAALCGLCGIPSVHVMAHTDSHKDHAVLPDDIPGSSSQLEEEA